MLRDEISTPQVAQATAFWSQRLERLNAEVGHGGDWEHLNSRQYASLVYLFRQWWRQDAGMSGQKAAGITAIMSRVEQAMHALDAGRDELWFL